MARPNQLRSAPPFAFGTRSGSTGGHGNGRVVCLGFCRQPGQNAVSWETVASIAILRAMPQGSFDAAISRFIDGHVG